MSQTPLAVTHDRQLPSLEQAIQHGDNPSPRFPTSGDV
jgi:hypothetical protein